MTLDQVERQVIERAYVHFEKNKTRTAASLGVCVKTIENKLNAYDREDELQKERSENAKREREEFAEIQRNGRRDRAPPATEANKSRRANDHAGAGLRLESTAHASAQQTMPVSQREEIQVVLPRQASGSGSRKSR